MTRTQVTLGRLSISIGAALALLAPAAARAHWCDCLWESSYNLVVRPETTTVTVPSGGSATLNVFVQNNMGYLLPNFVLGVSASGATVSAKLADTLKVSGTLLPGEKAKYAITVGKSGGGTVSVEDITFSVQFGNAGQSGKYPAGDGKAVVVVKPDGSLYPASPMPDIGTGGDQAANLYYTAAADFDDVGSALDKLMNLYCAGRGSWNTGSMAIVPTNCPSATATTCPTKVPTAGSGTKFDYVHLWSAGELAARKGVLGTRLPVFRTRLQCGVNDGDAGFAGYALFMLGYLGVDATVQTFIRSKVSDGSLGLVAKAALYVMGDPADRTTYGDAVKAGLTSSDFFGKAACAAALGIADQDDAAVTGTLIPSSKWIEPDTSDDGKGLYASHLLALVAWDRRGWQAKGADTGPVSFYGDTGAPGSGGGPGAGGTPGSGGISGSGGVVSSGGSSGSGGAVGTGGRATGGAVGSGGRATGGAVGSGGRAGGAVGSGGRTGGGGSTVVAATGGAVGGGGAPGSGGSTVVSGSGGGSVGAGGSAAGGGPAGEGGAGGVVGSGGAIGPQGNGGATTSTDVGDGSSGGCSCAVTDGRGGAGALWLLGLLGLAALLRRKRR